MTTVTLQVRDKAGHLSAARTATVNWQQPAPSVVLGASLGQPLPTPQTLPAVRLYSPSKVANLPAGTTTIVLSDKSTSPTATVNAAKANPGIVFYATFHHEPDDDIRDGGLTVASWGATMNTYGRALATLPNVRFGPIHNGSFGRSGWVADEAACDKSLWDFWGMDRYCFAYENPATQFAEGAAYAKSLGLPLLIGETGAEATTPSKQKTTAAQIRAWSLDPTNNAAVVCWWQASNADHNTTFASADVQHAFLG
jgi:hypothetical protein